MYQLFTICILSEYFNEFASDIQLFLLITLSHHLIALDKHIQYDMFNIIYISLRNTSPKYHPPTPA